MEIVKRTYICNLCKQEIKEEKDCIRLKIESAHLNTKRLRFSDKKSHFHHKCFEKLFGEQLEIEA